MKMKMEDEPILEIKKGNGYSGKSLGEEGTMHKAMIEYMVESEDDESCVLRVMSIETPKMMKPDNSGDAFRDHMDEMSVMNKPNRMAKMDKASGMESMENY